MLFEPHFANPGMRKHALFDWLEVQVEEIDLTHRQCRKLSNRLRIDGRCLGQIRDFDDFEHEHR